MRPEILRKKYLDLSH